MWFTNNVPWYDSDGQRIWHSGAGQPNWVTLDSMSSIKLSLNRRLLDSVDIYTCV